jgi:hypothetical protein
MKQYYQIFSTGIWHPIWAGHVARMGQKRSAYMILVGNPEGKRPKIKT